MPDDDSHSTFNPSCVRHSRTYVTRVTSMTGLARIIHKGFHHGDTGDTERKTCVTNLLIRSVTVCLVFAMKVHGKRA